MKTLSGSLKKDYGQRPLSCDFLAHAMWEGGSLGAHKTTFNSAYAGRDSIHNTRMEVSPGTTVLVHY